MPSGNLVCESPIRQEHAVEPAMDDAIARSQRDAAAVLNEIGQRVLGFDIHGLRIWRSVTEALHHQICRKTEAREFF
jgi:hypothetical protein